MYTDVHQSNTKNSIQISNINPVLLTCAHRDPSQLIGFNNETNLTSERIVEDYEIVFFRQKGGYSVINGRKYTINKNAIRFHRPGDVVFSARYGEIFLIHFSLTPEYRKEYNCAEIEGLPSFMYALDPDGFLSIVESLLRESVKGNVCSIKSYLWQMIDYLIDNQKKAELSTRLRDNSAAYTVKSYIDAHYNEALGLEKLSDIVHLHPNYLHRQFKSAIGKTPLQYQTAIRLKHAYNLLLTTDDKLMEICGKCGFNTESYFISLFKKKYGLTPYELRQQSIMATSELL